MSSYLNQGIQNTCGGAVCCKYRFYILNLSPLNMTLNQRFLRSHVEITARYTEIRSRRHNCANSHTGYVSVSCLYSKHKILTQVTSFKFGFQRLIKESSKHCSATVVPSIGWDYLKKWSLYLPRAGNVQEYVLASTINNMINDNRDKNSTQFTCWMLVVLLASSIVVASPLTS